MPGVGFYRRAVRPTLTKCLLFGWPTPLQVLKEAVWALSNMCDGNSSLEQLQALVAAGWLPAVCAILKGGNWLQQGRKPVEVALAGLKAALRRAQQGGVAAECAAQLREGGVAEALEKWTKIDDDDITPGAQEVLRLYNSCLETDH